ncbi:hypothetical protein EDB85DRAFT_2197847 [Lactarius pseudohatsudake]|nr:hypothetical protein EDB85DRAFT_2197847 [Lactarius pseudohatsudake]
MWKSNGYYRPSPVLGNLLFPFSLVTNTPTTSIAVSTMTFLVRLVVIIPALTNLNTGSLVKILKSINDRGQRLQQFSDRPTPESQFAGGSDVAAGNKRPNSISLPHASSVDLASASLPPRGETEVPRSWAL